MASLNKPLFSKMTRSLVMPVVLVNIIGIIILFVFSLFVDYRELYAKLPIAESIEFQISAFILILIFEISLISIIVYRFFNNSTNISLHIRDMITEGENQELEFKSSLRFDYTKNELNKELEYVVAKTISAFLNTDGGTILIGINDQGEVLGIKADYDTLKKKNADGFIVYFTQIISHYLGKESHRFLQISVEIFEGKEICHVKISPSKKPVYVNHNDRHEFFIRTASSVQPMDVHEAHEYISNHWNK